MASSLIPERPLLISPTLAATIGLEEAVMLHVIGELQLRQPGTVRTQRLWTEIHHAELARALPFWDTNDIKRIQRNLREKGLILVEPCANPGAVLMAINQKRETGDGIVDEVGDEASPGRPAPATDIFNRPSSGKATFIPPNWQPSEELYQLCAQRHIPRDFIEQRVRSFVMYQRERGKTQYSWHNAFLKYIVREWRNEQSYQGAKELETDMTPDWQPSEDALDILEHAGISRAFIEDAVPEFVLYWRERGLVTSTWNTKFIAHVRRQWAKYTAALEHDTTPRLIPADYQPSEACLDVLAMANIDLDFARNQVKEFVLYWQDRKEVCSSWNTRFLQHIKFRWATRDQCGLPAERQLESTIERMTDRSWAE